MHRWPAFLFALLLGCGATASLGQASLVTDGRVQMRIDPRAGVLSCIVTATSGDAATDDAACLRALDERWQSPDLLPPDVGIVPDREGRFVECRPPQGMPDGADFPRHCAARLGRLRLARAMVPIAIESWIPPAILADMPRPPQTGRLRLGISDAGQPTYCLIATSTGNAAMDSAICAALMERARFHPARDEQGRPMPSVFNVGL